MLGDLVKFNMTNDIQLSVDMRAGQEPGTTDYEIFVQEPDPRTFTLFRILPALNRPAVTAVASASRKEVCWGGVIGSS